MPTPDSGSVFAGWAGDCSGTGACAVTMASGHTVEAIFNAGSCTYSISPEARSVTYKGDTLIINVTDKDYAGCPAPDIINNSDWITLTVGDFANNRGSLKLSVPEHDSSIGRSGTLTIARKTVTITQKGKPRALKFGSYTSPVLSGGGGSGAFEVTVAPADYTWTTASFSCIHLDPCSSGKRKSGLHCGYEYGNHCQARNNNGYTRQGHESVTSGRAGGLKTVNRSKR